MELVIGFLIGVILMFFMVEWGIYSRGKAVVLTVLGVLMGVWEHIAPFISGG
jgi:uncharacterized membrane protein